VTLGIRPEHLALVPPTTTEAVGRVAVVERMGYEAIVALHPSGGGTLRSKVRGLIYWRAGEAVALSVDAAQLHFFDSASGMRIEIP
jgi:ABC-type sugar transport system ATPase subunit